MEILRPLLALLALAVIHFIDSKDETMIHYARWSFGIAAVLSFALAGVLLVIVLFKAELAERSVSMPASDQHSGQRVTMTHRQYDLGKLWSLVKQLLISAVSGAVLHYRFDLFPPLVFLSFILPSTVLNSELAWIHLFCVSHHAVKELRRPWEENQRTIKDLFREVKREFQAMKHGAGGAGGAGGRRSKRLENARRVTKRR